MEDKILKLEEAVMSKCCSRETDTYITRIYCRYFEKPNISIGKQVHIKIYHY